MEVGLPELDRDLFQLRRFVSHWTKMIDEPPRTRRNDGHRHVPLLFIRVYSNEIRVLISSESYY